MPNPISEDFVGYCRTLKDWQLENVLMQEYKAFSHRDYPSAEKAAQERGWTVEKGVVTSKGNPKN